MTEQIEDPEVRKLLKEMRDSSREDIPIRPFGCVVLLCLIVVLMWAVLR